MSLYYFLLVSCFYNKIYRNSNFWENMFNNINSVFIDMIIHNIWEYILFK